MVMEAIISDIRTEKHLSITKCRTRSPLVKG